MGFKQLILAFVGIFVFTVAILSFAIQFGDDNDSATLVSGDLSGLNTELNANLSSFREDSQDSYQSMVESSTEGETTPTGGSFSIAPPGLMGSMISILRTGYKEIFGTDGGFAIFLTVLTSIFVFILFIAGWKAWIGRDPE